MAPGTPIAGDGSRGNLHRWPDTSKVYTRKIHNKAPKINPQPQPQPEPQPPPPPEPPASAADDVAPQEAPPVEEVRPASPDDASSHQEDSRTVKISLRSTSRDEIRELRKRLADELEQVRAFSRKIESDYGGGEGEHAQSQDSVAPAANGTGEGFEKEEDRMASYRQLSVSIPEANGDDNNLIEVFEKKERTPNYHQLNGNGFARIKGFEKEERTPKYRQVSANYGMMEGFEKQKRTPKANQLYQNSDFILIGKDKFPPVESNKKLKHNRNGHSNYFLEKKYAHAFKSCAALLARLMKHKFGWVFNAPVDVKGLGLHDYYTIIKHPMDLGTVKLRLNKNWYKSPAEFAEDVRLTFRNAMTYNPQWQDVHIMAQQLSQIFEERWPSIEAEYAYVPYPPTPVAKKPPPIDVRMLERSDSTVYRMAVETKNPLNYPPPAPTLTPTLISRSLVSRQPKPKAKDLYKREMTTEEKQKLSGHLQNLPPEKLDGVVQIIRKRNSALCPQEDEIEIDIDCVDTETLWELDRFVTNYKKSLSKYKRKAELAILANAKAERERGPETVMEMGVMGEPRENNTVMDQKEDDSSFPVGEENKRESPSRSNSSSSSSSDSGSSSSDSDSDSSSESDAAH